MFNGKDEDWNGDVLNANFVKPCIHKLRKCTKPDNSQNLNICCSKNYGRLLLSKIKVSQ